MGSRKGIANLVLLTCINLGLFFSTCYAEEVGQNSAEVSTVAKSEISKDKYKYIVEQKDKKFNVSSLKVKVNDPVVFMNGDLVVHNVFSKSKANDFNLKVQAPGSVSVVKFKVPGTVKVFCAIHPQMKLQIEVVE